MAAAKEHVDGEVTEVMNQDYVPSAGYWEKVPAEEVAKINAKVKACFAKGGQYELAAEKKKKDKADKLAEEEALAKVEALKRKEEAVKVNAQVKIVRALLKERDAFLEDYYKYNPQAAV